MPSPFAYACLTEFDVASVIASLRSASVSSSSSRTRESPVSARRASEMYSAFAGMVRRIACSTRGASGAVTASSPVVIHGHLPQIPQCKARQTCRISTASEHPQGRLPRPSRIQTLRVLVARRHRRALREAHRQAEEAPVTEHGEGRELTRLELARDDPDEIVAAPYRSPGDRDDDVSSDAHR